MLLCFFQCLPVCHSVPPEIAEIPPVPPCPRDKRGARSAQPCRSLLPLAAAALLAPALAVTQLSTCMYTTAQNLVSDATPNNKFLPAESKGNAFT